MYIKHWHGCPILKENICAEAQPGQRALSTPSSCTTSRSSSHRGAARPPRRRTEAPRSADHFGFHRPALFHRPTSFHRPPSAKVLPLLSTFFTSRASLIKPVAPRRHFTVLSHALQCSATSFQRSHASCSSLLLFFATSGNLQPSTSLLTPPLPTTPPPPDS